MDVIRTELCEYLQVRHSKLEATSAGSDSSSSSTSPPGSSPSQDQASLPIKFYKVAIYIVGSCSSSYKCDSDYEWLLLEGPLGS